MVVGLKSLIEFLLFPSRTAIGLNNRPRWIFPFCILALVSTAEAFLTTRDAAHLAAAKLLGKFSDEYVASTLKMIGTVQTLGALFTPAALLLKWAVVSALIYISVVLLGAGDPRFKRIFVIVVHAEIILILMSLANILLLHLRGPVDIREVTDLQALVGLDVFLNNRSSDPPLFVLLNSFNVFSLWYITLLTIGISVVAGLGRFKACVATTGVWILGVLLQVASAALGARFQSLFAG
jgi:hypothetical protein